MRVNAQQRKFAPLISTQLKIKIKLRNIRVRFLSKKKQAKMINILWLDNIKFTPQRQNKRQVMTSTSPHLPVHFPLVYESIFFSIIKLPTA